MSTTKDDLREAERAVAIATDIFSTLDPRGVGPHEEPYNHNQHSFDTDTGLEQVRAAIEFLMEVGINEQLTAGAAKRFAEIWASKNGFSPYISPGAMIVAAVYLNLPYDGDFEGGFYIG